MSAVGAVICNSYQDTGSYLSCGSHKALFKSKDKTEKSKQVYWGLFSSIIYLAKSVYEVL